MKVLVFLVLAIFAACVKGNKEMMVKIIGDCKAKIGATDDDVAKMMISAPAENPRQKCMFMCFMESTGMVNPIILM